MKTLLVPTDFSGHARAALSLAGRLAAPAEASIFLLHVVEAAATPDPALDRARRHREEASCAGDLAREIEAFDVPGVRVERVCLRAPGVPEAIVRYARTLRPDLIVMGTHGRGGIARLVLGSVAAEVLAQAPCDVLLVREGQAVDRIEQVLVPVALSDVTRSQLARAAEASRLLGARMDVLYAIPPLAFPVSLTQIRTVYDLVPDLQERVRRRLRDLVGAAVGPDAPRWQVHVVDGPPDQAILSFAEAAGSDLIVVGRREKSRLARFALGSVSERVARQAPCPVWVVHEDPEDTA